MKKWNPCAIRVWTWNKIWKHKEITFIYITYENLESFRVRMITLNRNTCVSYKLSNLNFVIILPKKKPFNGNFKLSMWFDSKLRMRIFSTKVETLKLFQKSFKLLNKKIRKPSQNIIEELVDQFTVKSELANVNVMEANF